MKKFFLSLIVLNSFNSYVTCAEQSNSALENWEDYFDEDGILNDQKLQQGFIVSSDAQKWQKEQTQQAEILEEKGKREKQVREENTARRKCKPPTIIKASIYDINNKKEIQLKMGFAIKITKKTPVILKLQFSNGGKEETRYTNYRNFHRRVTAINERMKKEQSEQLKAL